MQLTQLPLPRARWSLPLFPMHRHVRYAYIRTSEDLKNSSRRIQIMKNILSFVNVRALFLFVIIALLPATARSQHPASFPSQSLMSKLKSRCVGRYIGRRLVTVTGFPGNNQLSY